MKNNEFLDQSIAIFNTIDKWNALFEIHAQSDDIMGHWLKIGAQALRQHFAAHPSTGWECACWELERDSRWHLTEFGPGSVGIGFGWVPVEFHLHLGSADEFDREVVTSLLASERFRPLVALFGSQTVPPWRVSEGSLASDRTINPYGGASDDATRYRSVSWHAAHETADYVEQMASIIRQITDNEAITDLLRDLNRLSKRKADIEPTT